VVLLFNGNTDGSRPVRATAHVIVPCGIGVVFVCLPIAIFAVVVGTNWMKIMRVAVVAHVPDLSQLLGLGVHLGALSLAVAFLAIVGVWVNILVALVCCELRDSLGEGLDLHQHCIELGVLCLYVGCMVIVGRCHTHYLGNVVTDFSTTVRKLMRRLVLVLSRSTAPCVLLVCVGRFHQRLKVLLGEHVVGLDSSGLLLPIKHFVLVKMIAVVHLLQVKLEFVFTHNCYVRADKRMLVIVEVLPKGGEMFVAIPLDIVCIFQCFLCFDIEGAPAIVQMFQDLEGGDVMRQCFTWKNNCSLRASRRLSMITWRKPFRMNHPVRIRSQSSSLYLHLCVGMVFLMDGSYDMGSMGIV
jgi:hypothetical protein